MRQKIVIAQTCSCRSMENRNSSSCHCGGPEKTFACFLSPCRIFAVNWSPGEHFAVCPR